MPGMLAFGRRWSVATDDFIIVGIVDSIFFLGWLCQAIVAYSFWSRQNCICHGESWCTLFHVFLVGICVSYLLNVSLAISFLVFSLRGTVSNPKPRETVVILVYLKCVLSCIDVVWMIVGTILIKTLDFVCDEFDVDLNLKMNTGCFWFIFLIRVMLIFLAYDSGGAQNKGLQKCITNEYFTNTVPARSAKKWRNRLRAFCFWCTAPSEDKTLAISSISQLLAFLAYDQDLVASDFIAALKLYKRECMIKHKNIEIALESTPSITLQDGTPVDCFPTADFPPWMNLKLASHYFSISMGVFGWPWTVYRNYSCGLCSLWKYIRCCFCCRKNLPMVKGDNCCGCNFAGLQVTSEYQYEDLVHVSFVNQVYEIPFFVAIDESTSSVLLSLRGSMSCADALTDTLATYSPLGEEDLPKETLCHTGMLLTARKIKGKLEHSKVLENAFSGREDYHLVLTGHSLGASIATLLTLMLRKSYPNIRCFAFAPPPVVNEAVLNEAKDYIFTIYFGNDLVPYFNYHNVRETIIKCAKLFHECQLPKYKVLLGWYDSDAKDTDSPHSTTRINIDNNCVVEKSVSADGEELMNGVENDPRNCSEACIDVKCNQNLILPFQEFYIKQPFVWSPLAASFIEYVSYMLQINNEVKADTDHLQITSMPTYLKETRLLAQGRILHIKYSKFGYRFHVCDAHDYHPLVFGPDMILHHFPHFMENCLKQFSKTETLELKTS